MLRLTVATAALTLLCMPTIAGTYSIPLPPLEYSGPYRGHVTWHHVSLAKMQKLCGGYGLKEHVLACALPQGAHCVIVMPRIGGQITRTIWHRLRIHELGHCNGWPGDHPNPRWQ